MLPPEQELRRAAVSLATGLGALVAVVLGIVVWGGVGVALLIAGLLAGAAGVALAAPLANAEGQRTRRRRVAVAAFGISVIACVLPVVALLVAAFGEPMGERPDRSRSGAATEVGTDAGTDTSSDGDDQETHSLWRLGQPALTGPYTVTVDAVAMDADAAIAAADPANPAAVGQYVLVDLTVAYRGMTEGNPADEVAVYVVASDGFTYYAAADCAAVTDRPAGAIPTMELNTTASYSVCVDMPPNALPAVEVLVEDLNDDEEFDWRVWTID